MSVRCAWFDLGQVEYVRARDFQRFVHDKVRDGELDSAAIMCRHFPVITLGRQAKREHVRAAPEALRCAGIAVHAADRGGDVTYHGPGQLTLYPVLDLCRFGKDVHWYLRTLEEAVIDFLAGFGVQSGRIHGRTGVWVGQHKIASIGVAVKQWISYHGVSVNIQAQDLEGYTFIKPCGMDIRMTSLESQLKRSIPLDDARDLLRAAFMRSFHIGQEISAQGGPRMCGKVS